MVVVRWLGLVFVAVLAAGCGAVGTRPSIVPQWHRAGSSEPTLPPTCAVEIGDAREDVLEACGAPACRPAPGSWVYPAARFEAGAGAGYVVLAVHEDAVASIEACGASNCCGS